VGRPGLAAVVSDAGSRGRRICEEAGAAAAHSAEHGIATTARDAARVSGRESTSGFEWRAECFERSAECLFVVA
jgi:hypothetical protein